VKKLVTFGPFIAVLALVITAAAPRTGKQPSVSATKPQVATIENTAPTPSQIATPSPALPASAANATANYSIDWYSINGGGTTNASSPNYRMGASVGQSVAGAAASTNYRMGIGFWYGTGGGCDCPCKYDPQCDGVISDILDVTLTINRAFRGAVAVQDPSCPVERTDVDASHATDVIDVTKVINVAFRGQPAATNYVDPCL
jgi:hypothetical protein